MKKPTTDAKYADFPFSKKEMKEIERDLRFEAIRLDHQQRLNVRWHYTPELDGSILFQSFFNMGYDMKKPHAKYEGKGNGAVALKEVCALADEFGVKLVLWTIYPLLYGYYEKHNFTVWKSVAMGTGGTRMWFERLPETPPPRPTLPVVVSRFNEQDYYGDCY